jgi:glycerophosphoryl diester phosphodiesterase
MPGWGSSSMFARHVMARRSSFHDDTLDRLTKRSGKTEELNAKELGRLSLAGSSEHLPTFLELLRIWPYQLPLLTELKIDGKD